jgi:fumarate reductase subunit D
VRTRLPLAAWAVAGVVTIVSLMSSLWQAHHPMDHGMPSAEQRILTKILTQQAKV